MPHADSALVPENITTKAEFWAHTYSQLDMLLDSQQRNWVTNLSNASSLIYNSLLAFPPHFGNGQRAASTWILNCFRNPTIVVGKIEAMRMEGLRLSDSSWVPSTENLPANTSIQRLAKPVAYPGHIACDGETRSELVCPLILPSDEGTLRVLGVLDLDCLVVEGFDDEDKAGLEKIAELLVKACDW